MSIKHNATSAKSDISVYNPGSTIEINGVKAIVLQVCISAKHRVTYQVAWWNGNERRSDWVESCEVSYVDQNSSMVIIGFTQHCNESSTRIEVADSHD